MFSEPDYEFQRMQLSLTKLHAFGIAMNYRLGDEEYGAWIELERGLTEEYGEFFLDVVDWCLHQTDDVESAEELEQMLAAAGSAWRVAVRGNTFELIDRVEPVAEEAARTAAPPATSASFHLNEAWSYCHGRTKSPKAAYDEAVLAVEAVVHPVVIPKDERATLGKALKAMRDTQTKWRSPLGEYGVEAAIAMMNALWKQNQRHGVAERPITVRQEEAETAVQLAVTLVRWFSSGGIARVE